MIGEIIKALRKDKGITIAEAADMLGVATRTYSSYEAEEREPNITAINKLADFYGVTTDYLLGRTADAGTLLDRMQTDEELPFEARVLAAAYLSLGKADRERLMAMVEAQREKLSEDERIEVPTGDLPDPQKNSETSSSA